MKRFRKCLPVVLGACLILCVSAYAYYANAYASYRAVSRGVIAYSETEANTDWGLAEIGAQVRILDEDDTEYAFGTNYIENPTVSSITASAQAYDGTLTRGQDYVVDGYGYIKYRVAYQDDLITERCYDEKWFTYNGYRSAAVEDPMSRTAMEQRNLREEYREERAEYIAGKFNEDMSQYLYVKDSDMYNILSCEEIKSMREAMNITPGITSPAYFVNEENDRIIVVYQDADATNHMYEFCEAVDDGWNICDYQTSKDVGRYHDVVSSFRAYAEERLVAE